MSYIEIKSKFHCALDGQGLILQGSPDRLVSAYEQLQATVYGQRFASGDRDYNDLSQWWYFVQTDWSGGLKDTVAWSDDAKYYYSTNIDAWSDNGSIKLSQNPALDETFTEDVICGGLFNVAGQISQYVGTGDNGAGRPLIYQATISPGQTWSEVFGTTLATTCNAVSQIFSRVGKLWVLCVGSGTTTNVVVWDGTTKTDQTAYIDTLFSHQTQSAPCGLAFGGVTYIFRYNFTNLSYGLVKTTVAVPASGADWTKIFEKLGDGGIPISCAYYNGKIYYLVNQTYFLELYAYDIAAGTDTFVQRFNNTVLANNYGVGDKLLTPLNGKLLITLPPNEIWEIDGTAITRIFIKDTYKKGFNASEANAYLGAGCILAQNKAWWGNLVYDGTTFFNTYKASGDSTTVVLVPLYGDSSDLVWYTDSADIKKLYYTDPVGTAYKSTADKNFIVLNNFDKVAGVDKIAYSATILFKPLASGQSIVVEYFIGELNNTSTFTALGTASATLDGTSVREKTFLFGNAIIYKKIWFRIKLNGGGSDTPTMTDIVMEYLPMPTYKKVWNLNINCADSVKKLSGGLVDKTGRELKNRLEVAWWTKSLLDFQDMDYATNLLNGALTSSSSTITVDSTVGFPEQGRLKIDDEEIFYTGKTPFTFTGLTRGARGTRAASHSDNAVINNAYKVLITNLAAKVPIALQGDQLEYITSVALREA